MQLRRNFEGGACWVGNKVPLSCKGRGKIEKTRSTWHDIILSKLKTRATQSFVILGIEFSFPLQLTSSNQIGPLPPPNVTAVGTDVADVKFNIWHTTSASLMSHPLLQFQLSHLWSLGIEKLIENNLGFTLRIVFPFRFVLAPKLADPLLPCPCIHACIHSFIGTMDAQSAWMIQKEILWKLHLSTTINCQERSSVQTNSANTSMETRPPTVSGAW